MSIETAISLQDESGVLTSKPRLGFLGVGWIGRRRMQAIVRSCLAEVVGIADPSVEMAREAKKISPDATLVHSLDELMDLDLDGMVIATPSAFHASQAIQALEKGVAVFCQKPLARNARETRDVVRMARKKNVLLGVDFSYRFLRGAQKVRDLIRQGHLGHIYAIEMAFHNAYGPDKAWFYHPQSSGGGCLIDLGTHLVDLALWNLDFPSVMHVSGRLFCQGELFQHERDRVEDYATARMDLDGGTSAQLVCSWKLNAGCDAQIAVCFYGTRGGACLRNVNGSFYDFVAEGFNGTQKEVLAVPPDEWEGGAILHWLRQLTQGGGYDSAIERSVDVASVLDRVYSQER